LASATKMSSPAEFDDDKWSFTSSQMADADPANNTSGEQAPAVSAKIEEERLPSEVPSEAGDTQPKPSRLQYRFGRLPSSSPADEEIMSQAVARSAAAAAVPAPKTPIAITVPKPANGGGKHPSHPFLPPSIPSSSPDVPLAVAYSRRARAALNASLAVSSAPVVVACVSLCDGGVTSPSVRRLLYQQSGEGHSALMPPRRTTSCRSVYTNFFLYRVLTGRPTARGRFDQPDAGGQASTESGSRYRTPHIHAGRKRLPQHVLD
jgi:hypothetical protein